MSPDVLSEYLQSVWGLHLHFVPVGPDFVCQILSRILLVFGLSSVDPAPSGRAAVAGLQVLPMYCQSTFDPSGEVTFSVVSHCHESPDVLPSTFNSAWGVALVSAARCLLVYCPSVFNLSGGVASVFCASRS